MAEIEAGYGRLYDAAACDTVVRVFRDKAFTLSEWQANAEVPTRVGMDRDAPAPARPLPRGPHARGDGPQSRRAPRSHARRPAAPPQPHAEVSGRRRVGFAREAPANSASVGRGHDFIT